MLRHFCISDLHAGALTSLLTDRTGKGQKISPVTEAFGKAAKSFLTAAGCDGPDKAQLILLGDVLDLQFSKRATATTSALGYLTALSETGCFQDEVLATAGNHDHALWTDARLALHATNFAAAPDDTEYREATPAFKPDRGAESRLLNALLEKAGFGKADLRYPNIGFGTKERAVFLHHGHFVESVYRLMSAVKDAFEGQRSDLTAEDLAAENAGWIDFAWSTFGDAAGLGRDTELLYQNLLTSVGYRRLAKAWSETMGEALSDALPMSGNIKLRSLLKTASRVGLDMTVGKYRDTERFSEGDALTFDGIEGLRWYLDGPSKSQFEEELGGLPKDLTFIFGHTHKPFTSRITARGYPSAIKVMNTGGWTLNGPRLDNAEGASIVLIDDALNVANLRIFQTPKNGVVPDIYVEMLSDGDESAESFRKDIHDWIAQSQEDWDALRDVACKAYQDRQRYLLTLTGDAQHKLIIKAAE